jgi:SAM-dependent methyltransferase
MSRSSNIRSKALWHTLKPDWDSIETVLPDGKGEALDLGAGTGRHRMMIEQAGYKWSGCDYKAKPENDIIKADAHSLPFPDNIFDLVNIWQVMEYLHNPWQAMSEIRRVLKPGGIVIGSVSFLEPMHGKVFFNCSQYGLEEILRRNGFTDILLSPGIGCFSLIAWTWVRQLTGSELLAKWALWIERLCIWGLCTMLDILSAAKHAIGAGSNYKRRWLREVMPFSYAGQITFRATKGEDI